MRNSADRARPRPPLRDEPSRRLPLVVVVVRIWPGCPCALEVVDTRYGVATSPVVSSRSAWRLRYVRTTSS